MGYTVIAVSRNCRFSLTDGDIQLTLSFKSQGKGKSFINQNQSNAKIETNRTLIETNRINQEKLWKI